MSLSTPNTLIQITPNSTLTFTGSSTSSVYLHGNLLSSAPETEEQKECNKRALKYSTDNTAKCKAVVEYLSLCGYIGVPASNGGTINSKQEFRYHPANVTITSKYQQVPDYYGLLLRIDKNTWNIVQFIKAVYKVKEATTITELCTGTQPEHYLVKILK